MLLVVYWKLCVVKLNAEKDATVLRTGKELYLVFVSTLSFVMCVSY